ncbi:hypothetical protein AX14_008029 [Amanita brunnescens Koide BX004]|nr:hypothetical protein AX14_008029 [Amanita brunnescens Koide BX004]
MVVQSQEAMTPAQFEQLQQEVALLKDEKAGLTKVIEHDKAALRAAEDENAAMTLQVSLQNEDIDDKNTLIEEYQAAATDMLKKYGDMEILATGAKHELESAKAIIMTMKAQQTAEQKVYESRIERLKARGAVEPDLSSAKGDETLRQELAVAKERVAFLEKAYKDKSDALKAANTAAKKQGNQQVPPKTANKTPNLPKWGFEPSDDLPNSQPYWDYRNAYSDHIAAMVAATVTAIPHIPLASAISSAISTVSKAGPPPELAQKNKGKRPSGSSRPTSPAPSRPAALPTSPSPPVIPKPSPPPVLAHASLTMVQIVAGKGSFSGGSESSAVQAAKEKKVTWRMKETSKMIVNKPGARGTRTTELHLRIPRCDATKTLYKSSGSRLINEVISLLNKSANTDEIQAYKANPLTSAKWSARSNLLLKCSQPMGEMLKVALERSIRKNIPEGQGDEDSEVEVLNRDGAFHHSDYKAAFAFTICQNDLWHDQYDWCPAASSFDAELRAIEAALEHLTTRTCCNRATLFIDNKAAANSLFNFGVASSQMSVIRINMLLDSWLSANPERTLAVRFTPSHQGVAAALEGYHIQGVPMAPYSPE